MLAPAQHADGILAARVGHQQEPAKALDGDKRSIGDGPRGLPQRVVLARHGRPRGTPQRQGRSTHRARIRLRVKPSIARVVVIAPTQRAHREPLHGRPLAIVRQALDNAEPRAAVRAVDEWIPIPSIAGIEQLGQAVVAGCDVGKHERRRFPVGRAVRISKPLAPAGSSITHSRLTTTARGGRSRSSATRKASSASGSPSTSMTTP